MAMGSVFKKAGPFPQSSIGASPVNNKIVMASPSMISCVSEEELPM
jgi:hypothetical protein